MKTCCDEIARLFYEYMDQEISDHEMHELESHLGACGNCRGHLEFEKAARLFLQKRFSRLKLSPDCRDLIHAQLHD